MMGFRPKLQISHPALPAIFRFIFKRIGELDARLFVLSTGVCSPTKGPGLGTTELFSGSDDYWSGTVSTQQERGKAWNRVSFCSCRTLICFCSEQAVHSREYESTRLRGI
jgi:hypothetical protein